MNEAYKEELETLNNILEKICDKILEAKDPREEEKMLGYFAYFSNIKSDLIRKEGELWYNRDNFIPIQIVDDKINEMTLINMQISKIKEYIDEFDKEINITVDVGRKINLIEEKEKLENALSYLEQEKERYNK